MNLKDISDQQKKINSEVNWPHTSGEVPDGLEGKPKQYQPKNGWNNYENRDEKIQYAQSWNLAVTMIPEKLKESVTAGKVEIEFIEEGIEVWQKYFYKKLTERK